MKDYSSEFVYEKGVGCQADSLYTNLIEHPYEAYKLIVHVTNRCSSFPGKEQARNDNHGSINFIASSIKTVLITDNSNVTKKKSGTRDENKISVARVKITLSS